MKGVWRTDGENDAERLKVVSVYTAITGHISCLPSLKAIGAEGDIILFYKKDGVIALRSGGYQTVSDNVSNGTPNNKRFLPKERLRMWNVKGHPNSLRSPLGARSYLAHIIFVLREDRRPREPVDGQAVPIDHGQQ